MSAPIPMLWPVWSFGDPRHPIVAWMFDYDAAVDFVNGETERNLYIGSPKYDPRAARLVEVEHLGPGRIAA